ncbi:hypothetical protein DPX16_19806 [Anabarilius grahami]|uniref:Uncharacterized protein n=1 Tax=Anabarilius grahami TaxID=495550 RepID=A0A3N0Z4E4_ANAGA|nr:hypothetical protein DPX16_19806 [Anabarilius grahami]
MTVLCARATHTSLLASSDPGLVCHPQPTPGLEAIPEQPDPGPEDALCCCVDVCQSCIVLKNRACG